MSDYVLSRLDGGLAVALPPPLRGYSPRPEVIGAVQTTLGGRRILQRLAVKRTWSLAWNRMPDPLYRLILAFHDGTNGLGPWAYTAPDTDGTPATVNITDLSPTVDLTGFVNVTMTLLEV